MRFSEAKGRKVVSTVDAHTIGRVKDPVVDPRSRSIVALALRKTDGGADILPWADAKAVGQDAVTVEGPEAIVYPDGELATLSDKDHRILGKRVLTDAGVEIGSVKDVEFDPESGAIRALIVDKEEVPGDRLHGIGSYAVVVRR